MSSHVWKNTVVSSLGNARQREIRHQTLRSERHCPHRRMGVHQAAFWAVHSCLGTALQSGGTGEGRQHRSRARSPKRERPGVFGLGLHSSAPALSKGLGACVPCTYFQPMFHCCTTSVTGGGILLSRKNLLKQIKHFSSRVACWLELLLNLFLVMAVPAFTFEISAVH